jgi:hypothetical protein
MVCKVISSSFYKLILAFTGVFSKVQSSELMKMALKTLIMASFEFLDTFPAKNVHLFKKAWLVMNKTSFIKFNRIYFHLILHLVVRE